MRPKSFFATRSVFFRKPSMPLSITRSVTALQLVLLQLPHKSARSSHFQIVSSQSVVFSARTSSVSAWTIQAVQLLSSVRNSSLTSAVCQSTWPWNYSAHSLFRDSSRGNWPTTSVAQIVLSMTAPRKSGKSSKKSSKANTCS